MILTSTVVPMTAQPAIQLQSSIGQTLWNDCTSKREGMVDSFAPGYNPLLSGPASLALLLNAINVVYRLKYSELESRVSHHRFGDIQSIQYKILESLHEDNIKILITADELMSLRVVKELFEMIKVKENGMTLLNMNSVAVNLGFGTVMNYAKNESMAAENKEVFQKILSADNDRYVLENAEGLESLVSQKIGSAAPSGMIANYNPTSLGLTNRDDQSSYFGAIAAYHEGKILIMDGGVDGAVWVDAQDLYRAMSMVDDKSKVPMGVISIYELL